MYGRAAAIQGRLIPEQDGFRGLLSSGILPEFLRDMRSNYQELNGASGTPVELFVQSIATLSRIEVDLLTRSTVAAESPNPVTPT